MSTKKKPAAASKPAKAVTLDDIGKRTDIFRLHRKHILAPSNGDGKRFNVRDDFGDLEGLRDQIIAADGIKVPLVGHMKDGKFHLTDGERRLRAIDLAVEAGHKHLADNIPVRPEVKNYTDEQRTVDLLTFSSGKPLEMIEQAEVFRRLRDEFGLTVAEIHQRSGKTQQHVYDCLALVSAPEPVIQAVKDGRVSATLAATVVKESSSGEQAAETIEQGIRQAEASGKKKATARHIPTRRTGKKPAGTDGAADLKAARRDLHKRETNRRMHTDVTDGVDSVAKLRQVVEAVPRSQADFNRMDALEFTIDYLLGHKTLPDAIAFFRE